MEVAREIEELIKDSKIPEAFEVLKKNAPQEVAEIVEKSIRNPKEAKKLEGEWRDITLLLHFAHTSLSCSRRSDRESLVSCVVSSVNAVKLGMKLGLKKFAPLMMRNAARALILMDEKERAERMYLEAEKICEEIGDEEQLAAVENDLAALYYDLQKYADAKVKIEEALEIRRKLRKDEELAESLVSAAEIYVKLGDFDEAEKCYREAEEIYRKLVKSDASHKFGLAILLSNFGMFYRRLGKFGEAEKFFNESLNIFKELEERDTDFAQFVATALRHLADLKREMKEFVEAEKYYKLSSEKFREIQARWERTNFPAS